MAMWPGNKNIISTDFEYVGKGKRLQQSLYLGSYTTDFNQTFTKMMQLELATKAPSLAIWRVFHENFKITLNCPFLDKST